ncbi:MAG: cytochrome P460 family protein [Geminicoccales bacterium]
MRTALIATSLLMVPTAVALAQEPAVPYPEGYRDWHHVKSMVIEPGHPLYDAFGGIHHLYANQEALDGYRSASFADGAVIVFDLLEAERGENAVVEGPRKVLGVMHKDQARFAETGGWGFEAFEGDSTTERLVGADAGSACFGCHEAKARPDFVFSELRP